MSVEAGGQRPQTLYRFYNANHDLLYAGVTFDPGGRFGCHRKQKPWWQEVSYIRVEHYPDRASVEAAEVEAIKTEHPWYNVAHQCNGEPVTASAKRYQERYPDFARYPKRGGRG